MANTGKTLLALRCLLHDGSIAVFKQDSYDDHCLRHPELESVDFVPVNVKEALRKPSFYVAGYRNNATCYYLELYAINGIMKYAKVIVSNKAETINGEKVLRIKTAFKTDHVQEQKYGIELHYI